MTGNEQQEEQPPSLIDKIRDDIARKRYVYGRREQPAVPSQDSGDTAYSDLEREVFLLRQENQELRESFTQLASEFRSYQNNVEERLASLAGFDQTIERLIEENSELREQLREISSRPSQVDSGIESRLGSTTGGSDVQEGQYLSQYDLWEPVINDLEPPIIPDDPSAGRRMNNTGSGRSNINQGRGLYTRLSDSCREKADRMKERVSESYTGIKE
ncbi:MAG: hypothetical protein R6U32_05290, partial [Candidatus Woesearchaeota archaeon]